MTEGTDDAKASISLYEFYAIGIERLIEKAPWELERAVSAYHESFLVEQRCLGLSILLLLGEDHVPAQTIRDQAMPGFEDQTRASVNQAVFLRGMRAGAPWRPCYAPSANGCRRRALSSRSNTPNVSKKSMTTWRVWWKKPF
jgi:hypothetical protein